MTKSPLRYLLYTFVLVTGITSASAATYTVDNRLGRAADFDNLSNAIASALPGDTLYVMGSQTSYGDVTLAKTLTIYGPGYLLGENEIAVAEANPANLKKLIITPDASGSQLIGLQIGGPSTSDNTQIEGATGVTFRRCYFTRDISIGNSSRVDGISFGQCRTARTGTVRLGVSTSAPGAMNVLFSNSYMGDIDFSNDNSEAVVDQCVLRGGDFRNSALRNSIFTGEAELTFDAETSVEHCLTSNSTLPASDGNINNANLDLVFVGWNSGNPPSSGTTGDTWMKLVPVAQNLALAAGTNGQDLGMYGGSLPYVPSGVPPLPRISSIIAPALITSGEPITVEVEVTSEL